MNDGPEDTENPRRDFHKPPRFDPPTLVIVGTIIVAFVAFAVVMLLSA